MRSKNKPRKGTINKFNLLKIAVNTLVLGSVLFTIGISVFLVYISFESSEDEKTKQSGILEVRKTTNQEKKFCFIS